MVLSPEGMESSQTDPDKDENPYRALSTIAGSLAILLLEKSLAEGNDVSIPSLGITIKGKEQKKQEE